MKYSDKNKPLVCMMTQSTCYQGTKKFTPKGILWHDTGANNPTLKRYVQPDDNDPNREKLISLLGRNANNNDWNHTQVQAGLNCWVGKLADGTVTTVQTMPWDYKPWGCGSGAKGSCNNTHIQFEICEDGKDDRAYLEAAYREACEITAYLCKMYGIDPHGTTVCGGVTVPTILCHYDSYKLGLGSGHSDIYDWFPKFGKSMETVRDDVAAILRESKKEDTPTDSVPASDPIVYYRVRKSWADKASQIGAFTVLQNAVDCVNKHPGYFAFDEKGQQVYPKIAPGQPTSSYPMTTKADPKAIWDFLIGKIGNSYGVSGLMGNLKAESGCLAINLQNSGNNKLVMTDEGYTTAVDNGSYSEDRFIHDGYGYGLAQWTYYSRKQALYNYVKSKGGSIGSLPLQLEFLWKELQGYTNVLSTLKSAFSVRQASDIVLTQFERPADQGEAMQKKRAAYGQEYYEQYGTQSKPPSQAPVTPTYKIDPAQKKENVSCSYKTTADLNFRTGAGTNKAIIRTLPKGTTVRYYGYYTMNGSTKWMYVETGGQTGFVSSKYVKKA